MSFFHFELFLCLNGRPVPMVKQTLLAIDPYGLAEGLEHLNLEEEMEADLASFEGSSEDWWIHQALDLPTKRWVLRNNNIPRCSWRCVSSSMPKKQAKDPPIACQSNRTAWCS